MDDCLLGGPFSRRPELPGPAPPGSPAARRPAQSRPWYVLVPGHALHEKGLQRQKGAGPLVSSQEERALAAPLINRG